MRPFQSLLLISTLSSSVLVVAQTQVAPIDMKLLVGRKAVVQRMPLYVPGTFQTIPNTYAGQTATVVAVKPNPMFAAMTVLSAKQEASLSPQLRQSYDNAKSASTVIVEFEDGTKADTGAAPVMAASLSSYLELLPDDTGARVLDATDKTSATINLPKGVPDNPTCPMVVTKATSTYGGLGHALIEGLTKSEYQRAVEYQSNGFQGPHYLDIRIKNLSGRPIRAVEAFSVYANNMGDEGAQSAIISQNQKTIKPGSDYFGYAYDTSTRSSNGLGDITVYVNRVRFDDNSFWEDNGSHSCKLTSRIK